MSAIIITGCSIPLKNEHTHQSASCLAMSQNQVVPTSTTTTTPSSPQLTTLLKKRGQNIGLPSPPQTDRSATSCNESSPEGLDDYDDEDEDEEDDDLDSIIRNSDFGTIKTSHGIFVKKLVNDKVVVFRY